MEFLKNILKLAIQNKCMSVLLKEGAPVVDDKQKNLGELKSTKEDINELSQKFFSGKTSGVHKNKFNIKNVGNIFILISFDKNEISLFFPPNEEENCNKVFEIMQKDVANKTPNQESTQSSPVNSIAKEKNTEPFVVGDSLPEDFFDVNAKNVPLGDSKPAEPEAAKATPHLKVVPVQSAPLAKHGGGHGGGHGAPAVDYGASDDFPDIKYMAELPGESASSNGQNPIDKLLKMLIEKKGSDLHLTAGVPVCMRIDGDIERVTNEPISFEYMQQLLDPIIPLRNRREFAKVNDTDFAYEIKNVGRFRVNMFRDRNGVGSVMRVIPSKVLTADDLKLPKSILKFGNLSKGLVVVTGPTGSGKSTTLAAIVDYINKTRNDHLLTIEDPIEFVHQQQKCLVNHREIGRHTTSFSRALRAALREDPDIVLIGEMRDLETVAIGIETAETGHLVFGTLHTNTAVSTVDRIIDQFPEGQQAQIRMMLSASLKGVVAQTLLKKNGGGRVAAHEILVVNDAVSAMIREGKTHMIENHMQTQKKDGNLLLNDCLLDLVEKGIVDPDHAILKAIDKESLMASFTEKNIKFQTIAKAS